MVVKATAAVTVAPHMAFKKAYRCQVGPCIYIYIHIHLYDIILYMDLTYMGPKFIWPYVVPRSQLQVQLQTWLILSR